MAFSAAAHRVLQIVGLALRRVVKRRARDRQKEALRPDRQRGVGTFKHPAPHVPVQGLSFRDKKSLATASSPSLACNDRTVYSSTSAFFFPPRSKMSDAPSSRALAIVLEPMAHNGSLH